MATPPPDYACSGEDDRPCATIQRDNDKTVNGWWYLVACSQSGRHVLGWRTDHEGATAQAALWIAEHCPRPDKPPIREVVP
jgi:hypothetical protein